MFKHRHLYLNNTCCIFWPAFGCCALQTLIEIVIFNVFSAKKLKKARKLQLILLVPYFSDRQILFLVKEFPERDSNSGTHMSWDTKHPLYRLCYLTLLLLIKTGYKRHWAHMKCIWCVIYKDKGYSFTLLAKFWVSNQHHAVWSKFGPMAMAVA